MPVSGLPVAVETTLNALLTDNNVTSWKIAGEGENTVVVLRLKPASFQMSTNMADPVLNRNTQVQYYRKKPPSQIRRDQQRARQQQERQASGQHDEASASVLNTPSSTDARLENLCEYDPETEHTVATHSGHAVSLDNPVRSENDTLGLNDCAETCEYIDSSVLSPPADTDIEPVYENLVAGFSTSVVKSYVATLTEKSVQRHLRDKSRNKLFRKIALDRSSGSDILLCESDDLVLEVPCTPDDSDCSFWFVKQDDRHMLAEERTKRASLRRGKRVSRTQHADIQARAARTLETLHGLILFYLG